MNNWHNPEGPSEQPPAPRKPGTLENTPEPGSRLITLWNNLSQAGLGELTIRLGTNVLLISLILLVAWMLRVLYSSAQTGPVEQSAALAASLPTAQPTEIPIQLPDWQPETSQPAGIARAAAPHTTVPTRLRYEVSKYTVQQGDTLFGIAEKFNLKPETLLWGNQLVLGDNPHNLRPGQELNILPVNGTYYRWQAGDGLNGVSQFFGVKPEDIINFPGNNLDEASIGDYANPNIAAGAWLVVPNGRREFVTWSAPEIPRSNPAVARVLGPGACSSVVDGPIGIGAFIWPANAHFLSGFDYSPSTNHYGIDIDGETGDPLYAGDNGVVVYAGWNDWGYGNVVVINHGNGWQTLYAHMNTYNVGCGQHVFQGSPIGTIGSTGNSTGSHLHFEMLYNGAKVNPWDYLP